MCDNVRVMIGTHRWEDGDILIHCGDFTTKLQQRDFEAAVEDFDRFLGSLRHRHKVQKQNTAVNVVLINGFTQERLVCAPTASLGGGLVSNENSRYRNIIHGLSSFLLY